MIPKKIHYCWFGRNPLPELAKKCIKSWKKYLIDYEIKEWNEDNFDINALPYTREAYEAKKYAFVSDVARLYALTKEGGIYIDTDVEVLKSLDCFLNEKAFSGFETEKYIPTAIMGCEVGFYLFEEFLHEYDCLNFKLSDGKLNIMTNVQRITNACLQKGLRLNNTIQTIDGFKLYPKDYFCPKNNNDGEIYLTENSYAIHHFNGSWLSKEEKQAKEKVILEKRFLKYLNKNVNNRLFSLIFNKILFKSAARYYSICKKEGIKGFVIHKIGKFLKI